MTVPVNQIVFMEKLLDLTQVKLLTTVATAAHSYQSWRIDFDMPGMSKLVLRVYIKDPVLFGTEPGFKPHPLAMKSNGLTPKKSLIHNLTYM